MINPELAVYVCVYGGLANLVQLLSAGEEHRANILPYVPICLAMNDPEHSSVNVP